jgi:H+/Cl- antiporter ClcA
MPTASSTLATIMGVIVQTTVDLATTIFTTYWPYVLVFGIIAGLVGVFARFLHIGGKK